jgi:uncharacterized protein YqjF (DUF2071 family)
MTLLGDFNHGILDEVRHRPWPMPTTPWIMTQTWNDLLFAHWAVDRQLLATKIPPGLELDLFDGEAWLGIVPFHMTNVAPRLVPALPWISAFPELNVRTYVRVGEKPGVYFFSLDAGNPVAVGAARALFHLPYYTADMRVQREADVIHYDSRREPTSAASAVFAARYHPIGEVYTPQPGSLDHFLTERYCLYTVDASGYRQRVDIHHPPWPLQPASATITANTMAEAVGLRLPRRAPLIHFAKRQDMVAWASTRLE